MSIIPPELLLSAYQQGIFPMAEDKTSTDVLWFKPILRGIIPLEQFKLSKNTQRAIRNCPHSVKINADFRAIIVGCANRDSTWISPLIIESYCTLHALGYAHSVEIYNQTNELIGGLYGVALGAAFFGESMFQLVPDTAKFALYYCHKQLVEKGFMLWDTQYYTSHLGTMGCKEIPQREYIQLLAVALKHQAQFV